MKVELSLEEQRIEFANRKLLATPISGTIVWALIGISGIFFSPQITVWVIFIGTGSIAYLAMFISKYTGENFLDKNKPKNEFDKLLFFIMGQSLLSYFIAIPFFLNDYTSLPLTVGILTGTMWLTFSWIVKHWVGIFHAISRTVIIVFLWYFLPEDRFISIPFAIVFIYVLSILTLQNRKRK